MALMSRPRLLLLDEPSMGLAPLIIKEIFQLIANLQKERKLTVLLIEQNANAALKIADRGYVIETGKIVLEEDAPKLLANQDIKRAYLGREQREIWE
jgi:branched-chain amino acid transport system ATP-binding protein